MTAMPSSLMVKRSRLAAVEAGAVVRRDLDVLVDDAAVQAGARPARTYGNRIESVTCAS